MARIEVGYHVFVSGQTEGVGAVREVRPGNPPLVVIHVENTGEFTIPAEAIDDVEEQKVMLNPTRLEPALQEAIRRAHQAEVPPSQEGVADRT